MFSPHSKMFYSPLVHFATQQQQQQQHLVGQNNVDSGQIYHHVALVIMVRLGWNSEEVVIH